MKISVIVPFQKGIHYLTDCLDSLCEQSETDFEVLLINDHSEENIDSLLSSYSEKLKIRKIDLEKKTGVSAARNKGIRDALGDYIYFLDSDDYIEKNTLDLLYREAERQHSDIVYGTIKYTWFNRFIYHESGDNEVSQQNYIGKSIEDLLINRLELNHISILNMLVKRNSEAGQSIHFEENLYLYADIPVLADFLMVEKIIFCKEAEYVKRYHNDEILYPSLSNGEFEDRYEQLMMAYMEIKNRGLNIAIKQEFDHKLLEFCQEDFLRKFRQEKKEEWNNSKFKDFHQYVSSIDDVSIKRKSEEKVKKAFQESDYKTAKKKINRMLAYKKIKKMLTDKIFFNRTINKYFFERLPQKDNWIVFESFKGKNYSDSPKYIYEYLLREYGDQYKFVWIINDKDIAISGSPVRVKRFSLGYFYYMTRAKYWVNNMRQPVWYEKRKSQILLQTWHGTPLKKLVFDMDDVYSASPTYKRQVYSQSRFWDYLISDNPFSTEVFQSCFLYEKEKILETGYPRNDILYADNKEEIESDIRKRLGIPENKKTILYAPTWRDDEFYDKGEYKFALKLNLEYLRKEIGNDYVILLRTHYFIADSIDVTGMEDFVFNVSKYSDIAELYLISDICMTDYSSVFFDYANLRRPILFFTYDLEKYRDVLRGFYIDIENDVPGPLLFTNEEIAGAVKNIEQINEKYKEKYDIFYEKFCCCDDGHASERIVNIVFRN